MAEEKLPAPTMGTEASDSHAEKLADADFEDRDDVVKEGMTVLLQTAKYWQFVEIEAGAAQRLGKYTVQLRNLIGEPFGAIFEIDRGRLNRVSGEMLVEDDAGTAADAEAGDGELADNRGFADTNSAQKLNQDDIAQMKKDGSSGKEIIAALVANSDTWASKTGFSKAKWLKRKQSKYIPRLRVVRPTAQTVCHAYREKHTTKVGSLRTDSLALMLSYSNVRAGSQLLLWDEMMGVVTGAAAERMGLRGRIIALHGTVQPSNDAVTKFNFPEEDLARFLVHLPTQCVAAAVAAVRASAEEERRKSRAALGAGAEASCNGTAASGVIAVGNLVAAVKQEEGASAAQNGEAPAAAPAAAAGAATSAAAAASGAMKVEEAAPTENGSASVPAAAAAASRDAALASIAAAAMDTQEASASDPAAPTQPARRKTDEEMVQMYKEAMIEQGVAGAELEKLVERRRQRKRRMAARPSREEVQRLLAEGSDSLIIACRHDPTAALAGLLPLLKPGGAFAVYSEFLQPLIACFAHAQRNLPVVRLQLCDPWYREFQVLPGRTHPQMQMSATGGYILSGFRVADEGDYEEEAVAPPATRLKKAPQQPAAVEPQAASSVAEPAVIPPAFAPATKGPQADEVANGDGLVAAEPASTRKRRRPGAADAAVDAGEGTSEGPSAGSSS